MACSVFPVDQYHFGCKDMSPKRIETLDARRIRLNDAFKSQGMRRVVSGVLLVHQHGHPHALLLENTDSTWELPGGRLVPGEGDHDGLCRKLTKKMSPTQLDLAPKWEVGDLLAVWWKPSFESLSYPYIPAHITKPKECHRIFLIHLPAQCTFSVPKHYRMVAVPLFELYDNGMRYGPVISSLPQLLGRFRINFISAPTPANEPVKLDDSKNNNINKNNENEGEEREEKSIYAETMDSTAEDGMTTERSEMSA